MKYDMIRPEKAFYDFATKVAKTWGLDSLSSRLICILYLEPKKIAISELAEITGYSLASISNKMKVLEMHGMVEKIKVPGTKKVYYFMEKNLIKQFERKINSAYKAEVEPAMMIMPQILNDYKGLKLNKEQKYRKKIIEDYYEQIQDFVELFETINEAIAKIKLKQSKRINKGK